MNKYFINKEESYEKIIELLCRYKGLSRKELFKILKDQECRYLFFLLIRKYNCYDIGAIDKDFPSVNKNNIGMNFKKAEEKLLLNKKIRDMYFEAENIIEKVK
ncbi:ribose-5-phosphate isomerase [Clostridium thailandense]|uniref:Ribose-5-phosphate isomerase n=1 Tax=Clostridium thailandense TaxID=2794346 RepID=A0A949WQ69_9CLOT|nr:ribose-5-phosphate isomerase [Clostridium thailandense]MBV7272361.1 ribose-5-phosphate isomerase [Clostridium thailandense]MCH5135926.1 ribose-5-phosphate isomerase [Clostridiaceae bacterium UIB06]